jgi:hypothetical protein
MTELEETLAGWADICADLPPDLRPKMPPSPTLSRGERDFESPSLDGRGQGEGGNRLKSMAHSRQVSAHAPIPLFAG